MAGCPSSLISKTAAGTWITQAALPQNPLKVSGALKEGYHPLKVSGALKEGYHLTMKEIITGTSPSCDLNTPEIKFEDFAFGKTNSSHNESNMEVGNSLATYEQGVNLDSSLLVDCLSTDASNTSADDSYTMIDMSPGCRDLLQTDQFEQRMDIRDFMSGETHTDIGLPQPRTTTDNLSGNWLEATVLSQPQILESIPLGKSPPQLSIKEDDFNFSIPQEVLEVMENVFPEELMLSHPLPENNNVSSNELDMYLGTQEPDLLFGALEQSGLMDHDLDALNFEDSETTMSVGVEPVTMPISNDHNTFIQSMSDPSSFLREPITIFSDPSHQPLLLATPPGTSSTLATPTPGPLSSIFTEPITFSCDQIHQSLTTPTSIIATPTCPRPPSKKRSGKDVSTPVSSIKRQRRSSKKPLRFRESEGFGDSGQDELMLDNKEEEVRVAGRQREVRTFVQVKEEPDFTSNPTVGRTGRPSTQNLTDVEKYHRIRVLNNEASKRCRQKRKMTLKEMESELVSLGKRNKSLTEKHAALEKLRDRFQAFVNNYFRQRLAANK